MARFLPLDHSLRTRLFRQPCPPSLLPPNQTRNADLSRQKLCCIYPFGIHPCHTLGGVFPLNPDFYRCGRTSFLFQFSCIHNVSRAPPLQGKNPDIHASVCSSLCPRNLFDHPAIRHDRFCLSGCSVGAVRRIHFLHPHNHKQEALSTLFQPGDHVLSRFVGNSIFAPFPFYHAASPGRKRYSSSPDLGHILHSSRALIIHQGDASDQSTDSSHHQLFGTGIWNHHGPLDPERSPEPEDRIGRYRYPRDNTGRNSERSSALNRITSLSQTFESSSSPSSFALLLFYVFSLFPFFPSHGSA